MTESSHDSDSVDSEGYDRNDPYAAAAKIADKKLKLKADLIKQVQDSKLEQFSNTIIKNTS